MGSHSLYNHTVCGIKTLLKVFTELCTFMITSRSIILRMRNVSKEICGGNKNAHLMFDNPPPENPTGYEIMWKNMVESGRQQMTV
jgi:hypothetical protein